MTPTIADLVQARRQKRRITCFGVLKDGLRSQIEEAKTIVWPSPRWRNDIIGFAHDVLGVGTWNRQEDLLRAIQEHPRVSCRSGHKVSKSNTAAIVALWFYCSFPDARVVMSSVTSRQVDAILWREMRKIKAKAKFPIDGDMHEMARSGLKAFDFREVVGFTAREAEAVAGISGANLLYLLDEASGIPDSIFEAIEGNRAGGARVVMFSNPTRTKGEFFESHHKKKSFYRTVHISSEETPNVIEGREVIPGLAGRSFIDEKREEWGVDSALYRVRILGEFVLNEEGKIFSLHLIDQAEARWHDTPDEGRFQIGIDPAGPGLGGDESMFAVRRGNKILQLYPFRGISDAGHLVHLLGILAEHRRDREPAFVAVDREGPIGNSVYGLLRAHLEAHPNAFELIAVRSSDRAIRQPEIYDRVRDELWANAAQWLRDGGTLIEDLKAVMLPST